MINLISDTVTRPTEGMIAAIASAEVGDDVFRSDPTVNRLEAYVAEIFGKEAALYCPSGTMTNQIAIKCHTQPLDEIICDKDSHIYQYETGGYAYNSQVAIQLLDGHHGKITASQIEAAIRPDYDWLPSTRLVTLENSCNRGGGSYYTIEEIAPITELCRSRGLRLHLDGARLFNVLVETGETTLEVGGLFDSISICLSKGLGAPVGSLLIGDAWMIKMARRYRKVMGGGMRQAGYLAAAGQYALDHHIARLADDNARARQLGTCLVDRPYVASVRPVATNIVIFDLRDGITASHCLSELESHGIMASAFGPQTVRLVTHMHVGDAELSLTMDALVSLDHTLTS